MEQISGELQLHYGKYREIIKGLTMMSDAFMRNVLKQTECAEYVLRVIMDKKDLRITDVAIQQDHKNLRGRSAILGAGLAIYHIEKTIGETHGSFGDQAYIIYVDSSVQDDTELGRLMHDFHCKNADEMYSSILADRVRSIKETQKGVDDMCKEMEKIYIEGMEKGIEQGRREEKSENARSLFKMGILVEMIAEALKVSINEVREWLSGSARPV